MVREYDDVVAEAKKNKKEVHMARVHGICVEKNYQLSEDNPGRKFKGRGVLLGKQRSFKIWGTHLHLLKPHDGPISMDVFPDMRSSLQTRFKHTSRPS